MSLEIETFLTEGIGNALRHLVADDPDPTGSRDEVHGIVGSSWKGLRFVWPVS